MFHCLKMPLLTSVRKINMLEVIIRIDKDDAKQAETIETPLLSTVPTSKSLQIDQIKRILSAFRKAMLKLDEDDYRRAYTDLDNEVLCRLLQYTLSRARPVLTWELNLNKIEIPVSSSSAIRVTRAG